MDEESLKLIISSYDNKVKLIRDGYERTITALEQGYKAELQVKDELIEALRKQVEYSEQLVEAYKQKSIDLMEMARIMAPSTGPPGSRVDVRVTGVKDIAFAGGKRNYRNQADRLQPATSRTKGNNILYRALGLRLRERPNGNALRLVLYFCASP
ncbi:MAG: hypothetical protein F6J93_01020 [Oscillatoria sp. SIO1A7]|nr:hypothetical protein [Oscillatoria sp. SIO1A7]